jgi:TRAP-type C4-dicarboxylate transport system substrate-binding protein
MSTKKLQTSRRTLLKGTAASAAIAPFFIGRSAKAATHKLKIATAAPDGTPWANIAKKLVRLMKKNTEGEVQSKVYLSSALGPELETLKACKDGRCHGWAGTTGALSELVSEIGVFELPFLFNNRKAARAAMDKNRQMLHDLLWENGFKLVMFAENGYLNVGTTGFAAETPADLKGRKIRTMESKIHIDTVNNWGASAVPMGITEVLSSLQTGVIEGVCLSDIFCQAASMHLALTDWNVVRFCYQPACVLLSRKGFWDKASDEIKEAIDLESKDVKKLEDRLFRSVAALDKQLLQNFTDLGVTVHEPKLGPWKKGSEKVHGLWEKRTTKKGKELLKAIKSA